MCARCINRNRKGCVSRVLPAPVHVPRRLRRTRCGRSPRCVRGTARSAGAPSRPRRSPAVADLPKLGSFGFPPRMIASPMSPIMTSFWVPSRTIPAIPAGCCRTKRSPCSSSHQTRGDRATRSSIRLSANGAGSDSFAVEGVLRAFTRPSRLQIWRSHPSGSLHVEAFELSAFSATGVMPRFRSSASTVLAFHGSIAQVKLLTAAGPGACLKMVEPHGPYPGWPAYHRRCEASTPSARCRTPLPSYSRAPRT